MRIAAERVIGAPPEAVFARLSDFDGLEARAERRGFPIERLDRDPPGWRIGIDWHGMSYTVEMQVETVTPPTGYTARMQTRGVEGGAEIAVAAEGEGSRLTVTIEAEGKGLTGRMMLQTLGFARPMLEGRLERALGRLAAEIEAGASA